MGKKIGAWIALWMMTGCSSTPGVFVRGPANQVQFEKDTTQCQREGEKLRAQGNYARAYNDCMLEKGYREESLSPQERMRR